MTSNLRLPRALLALLAGLLATAGLITVAQAADPAKGTVSKASPKFGWGGTLTSSGITANAWNNGEDELPCETPICDPFTLTVADSGPGVNLIIKTRLQNAAAQGNNGTATIRVTDPSGTRTVFTGESGPETDLKITIKNAANGDYQIDTAASFICCGSTDYLSTAELTGAGFGTQTPPPVGEGGGTPPPVNGGQSGNPQQPAPTASLKVSAGAVSAKKVKKSRKIAATLEASAKLTNVTVVLVDKKKKLGSLKLASLEGTKKIALKLAKSKAKLLKKGKAYQLSAGGTDAQGRTVVGSVKLTVKK